MVHHYRCKRAAQCVSRGGHWGSAVATMLAIASTGAMLLSGSTELMASLRDQCNSGQSAMCSIDCFFPLTVAIIPPTTSSDRLVGLICLLMFFAGIWLA